MKFGLFSIYVSNPQAAFQFYTEILGFEVGTVLEAQDFYAIKSPGENLTFQLLLEPNDNPIATRYQQDLKQAGMPPLIFTSENLQEEYEALKAKGVNFLRPPTTDQFGNISTTFDDGFGNLISVMQPGAVSEI